MKKYLILALLMIAFSHAPSSGQSDEAPSEDTRADYPVAPFGKDDLELDAFFGNAFQSSTVKDNPATDGAARGDKDADPPRFSWNVGMPAYLDLGRDTATQMFRIKFSSDAENVGPFFVFGGGYGGTHAKLERSVDGLSMSRVKPERDPCAKLGLGFDLFASDNMSMDLEGSHVWGFDDPDGTGYFDVTLDMSYHF
jgi:hypothetical protein